MINKRNIDIWLASQDLNYVDLAKATGLSYKALHAIVHNKLKDSPRISSLIAIKKATGLSYDDLISAA